MHPFFVSMAFRTVYIEKAVSVKLDLNNIVIYYEDDNYYINLDEVSTIIFDDPRCKASLKLLATLCEMGINVVFTNSSHMPVGSLQTLYNNTRAAKKIQIQLCWNNESQKYLWTLIVKQKILNQIETLKVKNKTTKIPMLMEMMEKIEFGDPTNKEGIASRVYFKELFGNEFKRFSEDMINYCLNYIYQIIRSKISQEIVSHGYIPAIGICHKSEFNSFNLADDFIEPFRPICDYYISCLLENNINDYLTPEIKRKIVNILNYYIEYNGLKYKIHVVIQFYVQSLFSFLETGDVSKIIFPKLCIV